MKNEKRKTGWQHKSIPFKTPQASGSRYFQQAFLILATGVALNIHSAACAATTPDDRSIVLETIVVTAERRSLSSQKTPISMEALSSKDLEKSKIDSIMELQEVVPGLTVTSSATDKIQPFIRGIGTDIEGGGIEDAVAVYIDGVYQSRGYGETMRFIDADRIEVLKGPQGVLYGRNATGGAINIISKAPSLETSGKFDIQVDSRNQEIARGMVSGPISEGVAYGRLSVRSSRDEGDTKNILLNTRGNGANLKGLRGTLELMPENDASVLIHANYYKKDASTTMKPLHPEVNPLFTVFHATVIDDPRTVMQNSAAEMSSTYSSIDATTKWRRDSALFTSITAFRKTDYNAKKADLDGTEIPLLNVGSPTTGTGIPEVSHFFSQEFIVSSDKAGPLKWTGLLSYTHEKVDSLGWNFFFPLFNITTNSVATVKTDAVGLGGQATYAINDRTHLTAGARYSTETKRLESLQTFVNGTLTGSMRDKETWSALTPKLVVDYSPDRDTMLYASATKGFKSGGFNTISVQPGFDPETATSYEAGIKSLWLDGRLAVNLAAFYTQYDNMQVAVVRDGTAGLYMNVENAAKAVSRGIDINLKAKPTSRLELSSGVQLLNARLVEFTSIDARFPSLGPISQKGNPLPRAPEVTANLGAQYTWPIAGWGGQLTLRGEGYFRSKLYYTPFKDEYAHSPGISVWNAMLSYEHTPRNGWYGSAFIQNLTDETYTTAIFAPQSLGYLAYYAPGRTGGVQIGYRF